LEPAILMKPIASRLSLALVTVIASGTAFANTTAHDLSASDFSQNWTNTGLITTNDDWSGVPSIVGFRGDNITASTGADPQTLLADDSPGVVDVNANQTNPVTFTTGGTGEFELTDPTIALTGSGTADAPYLMIYLNATGRCSINVSYNVRDLDSSADDAIQQLALHYRTASSGGFTSVPGAYVADGTTANAATQVTAIGQNLPAAAEDQAILQLRIMTTNAAGNDEWLGIDDINVTSSPCAAPLPDLSINDVTAAETNSGTTTFQFTVSLSAPAPADVTFDIATADDTATVADGDYQANSATGQTIATGQQSATFNVIVNGDDKHEPDGQQFFVNVSNVTGANVIDAQGVGTITDDDSYPVLSASAAASVTEGNAGNAAAAITYTLSNPADQDTTISVDTADGTATLADNDYVQLSGAIVTIPAGDTSVVYNGAEAIGDIAVEPNETFTVEVTDYLVGAPGRAPTGVTLPAPTVVTIINDDASADLSIAVTDSPDPVVQGQDLTYVVTLTNAGPSNADGAGFTLDLPAGTTFVSLTQPGMWNCTTPAVGANGSVSCNDGVVTAPQGAAKMGVGSAQFTIVANVPMSVLPGTVLTADLDSSAVTSDPDGQNNTAIAATTVAAALSPSVPVPALDPRMLAVLALLMAAIAATSLRRGH
jgi:uncharacterized repeat protein (TIGR01451 family)